MENQNNANEAKHRQFSDLISTTGSKANRHIYLSAFVHVLKHQEKQETFFSSVQFESSKQLCVLLLKCANWFIPYIYIYIHNSYIRKVSCDSAVL